VAPKRGQALESDSSSRQWVWDSFLEREAITPRSSPEPFSWEVTFQELKTLKVSSYLYKENKGTKRRKKGLEEWHKPYQWASMVELVSRLLIMNGNNLNHLCLPLATISLSRSELKEVSQEIEVL
jgi:hypothetical protein